MFLYKNLLASIGDNVNATKEDTTIEKDKAIAVSLNKVPEIPSIKIKGRKTATKINVVAMIAKEICLEPLYAATNGDSPFSIRLYIASVIMTESSVIIPIAKITDEAFDKVMNNNVKSNLWLSNMIIPKMAEAGGGKVIVISSIAGITGSDVLGAYSVSKTADLGLVRSLAVEWGPKNINVNALLPGIIKTNFARALWENPDILGNVEKNAPLRRIGVPDEVAGAAILLASNSGAFITGQTIVMDGGVTISGTA